MRVAGIVVLTAAALVAGGAARAATGPADTTAPSVTGTLQQGKKLTAFTGTWVGSGTLAYAFQWYRCDANAAHCSSIHGATKGTYTEVAADVGHSIGLTVRATDANGTTSGYAPVAGLVAPAKARLVASAQPSLGGDPIVGTPLSVEGGAWTATPASSAYAWLRCNANGRACTPLAGQTASSYKLVADDVGHTIVAAVTAAAGTAKQTVLTLRSAIVRQAPGPVLTSAPTITGTLQGGKKLTAFPGTWSSGDTVTYAFQWYRCDANAAHCSSIHGATKSTYTLVGKDDGQTIGLTVKATDSTGTTPAYAPVAGLVAAAGATLVASSQPALSGTFAVGSTLTVGVPAWSTTPSATTYAWLRCNANGRLCTSIAGQTGATYAVTAADAGHALVAAVTATAGTTKQTVLSLTAPIPA